MQGKAVYTSEKAETFLRRLRGTEGNVTLAATSLGLSRRLITLWKKNHPEFKEQYDKVRAGVAAP